MSEEIVGFAGLYQWRPDEAELCGMVHPNWRRRRIGSALVAAALAEGARRRVSRLVMVVDANNEAGSAFANVKGGRLLYSEYRMQQQRQPDHRDDLPPVLARPATEEDVSFVAVCLARAFGDHALDEHAARLLLERTIVIEDRAGEAVGVMRVEREAAAASIYGFAVLPERQHTGIGRAALCAVTRELNRSGVGVVSLEVLASNEGALGLYTTCGFDVIGTEDYYLLPLVTSGASPPF